MRSVSSAYEVTVPIKATNGVASLADAVGHPKD
jgi:hypothetical protein